jgi:hypothetical protein
MDTSEKYIKMCEKAQEIQDLKTTWDDKDFFGISNNNIKGKLKVSDFKGNTGFLTTMKSLEIWLPRQDQLQEIHPIDLVMGILGNSWSDEMGFDKEDERLEKYLSLFKTNEQVHLAFIMKEKYNKIWNEEQQDWVQL